MTRSSFGGSSGEPGGTLETPTVPIVRSSNAGVPLSTLFDVLKDKERRFLLYYLSDAAAAEEWIGVETVVDELRPYAGGRQSDAEALELRLVHVHLPKLDGVDVIQYDDEGGQLRYDGHPLLEQWLRRTREMDLD